MTEELSRLLEDKESIRFYDIDGTLAFYEYGPRNHNACREDYWFHFIKEKPYFYKDCVQPIPVMQSFLELYGDPQRDFVVSCTCDEFEQDVKAKFVHAHYPEIPHENVYRADSREDKLGIIKDILRLLGKEEFAEKHPEKIIMMDDSTDVLTHIQEHSDFTTIHVSSFIDINFMTYLKRVKYLGGVEKERTLRQC